MSTVLSTTEKIKKEILAGTYGVSGSVFCSIRELAEKKNISYVSAQKVTCLLRKSGFLSLFGNHQYVTYGPIDLKSPLAQFLKNNKSERKRIGMYINRMTNAFFTSIANYISKALQSKGYELVILTGDGSFEKEKNALESFIYLGAEAVISCAGFGEEIGEVYKNYILPTIFVGRYPINMENSTSVLVNNVNAGRQVASHLVERGCRSFVYVCTTQLRNEKDMRLEGYKKQLALDGVVFEEDNIIYLDPDKHSESRAVFKNIYSKCEKPMGVFCYHDMLAVSVIGICNRYNIKIPEEVKLAGFDNLPLCEVVSPKLTSISYRFDTMADEVVNSVFELIKHPKDGLGHKYVNQSLVVRKSTGDVLK